MRTFNKTAAQGDVCFRRVDAIPTGLREVYPENGRLVVTHSETGHHHVLEPHYNHAEDRHTEDGMPCAQMFSGDNPLMAWIKVNRPTALIHLRPHDTHEPIMFSPGIYEVRRQREYTPEGWRRVED